MSVTKKLRVTVEGRSYDVEVEVLDETGGSAAAGTAAAQTATAQSVSVGAAHAESASPAASGGPSASGGAAGAVRSPLAGKIVSVDCKVGQPVKAGQQLITVEAMKMNTVVNAPSDGTVKDILVQAGDGVEEGQDLVILG